MTKTLPQVIDLISQRDWSKCTDAVSKHPEIASTPSPDHGNKTLLHLLVSARNVPHNLLLMVISMAPTSVGAVDNRGYLPLHYGVLNTDCNAETIRLLLECHRSGAAHQGADGNVPLHLAFSIGGHRWEETVRILIDAHPGGVFVTNNVGKLPLHLACANTNVTVKMVKALLHVHSVHRRRPTKVDDEGNSPLHTAIKSSASHEIIATFTHESYSFNSARLFLQRDANDMAPLHIALSIPGACPKVVTTIIESAPSAASMPFPNESMPVHVATERENFDDVVRALLIADIPIKVGFHRDVTMANIERKHSHSWWYVLVENDERYLDVVEAILSEMATLPQVIALARVIGPDKSTRIIEAVSAKYFAMFSRLLRFYSRYELLATADSDTNDDFQTFHALDHDQSAEYMCLTNDGPCISDPFSTDSLEEAAPKLKICNSFTADDEDGVGVEVSIFNCTSRRDYEVILRCYNCEEAYFAEINVRERYNLSPLYVEPIYRHHYDPSYHHKAFGSGKLCCIAFEESDHSLADVFHKTAAGTRSSKWISKSAIVLKQIASALGHLHGQGVIHGHMDPHNVSKFGNKWKLTNVGTVTPIGKPMRGPLRHCIPPEAVSLFIQYANGTSSVVPSTFDAIIPSPRTLASVSAKVTFGHDVEIVETCDESKSEDDDKENNDFSIRENGMVYDFDDHNGMREYRDEICRDDAEEVRGDIDEGRDDVDSTGRNHGSDMRDSGSTNDRSMVKTSFLKRTLKKPFSRSGNLAHQQHRDSKESCLKFIPEKCTAHPSWDVWSFGLIMVQLLLGRSVHLPNFEKADDALLYNLHSFDEDTNQKIQDQIRTTAGDAAADLVAKLLHPDPSSRPSTITKVLKHRYFHPKKSNSAEGSSHGA